MRVDRHAQIVEELVRLVLPGDGGWRHGGSR
jgi:hypothetical protein